ncbi:hypothetical protein B0H11DRAFT_2271706 [Mycena galericulata]|nr:hypothetical protein B0H11DRAFT_2271706 [Mycena galericulata]
MSERTPAIFTLPNELLEAIVAAGQGQYGDYLVAPAIGPEWSLSRVSRRLRRVIISAPILWTRLVFDLDSEGSVEIIKLYLERSGTCTISVTLRAERLGVDVSDFLFEERVGHLIPHVDRLRRLAIGPTGSVPGMLAPFENVAAPCLEYLDIRADRLWSEFQMNIFSLGAPRLTVLKWKNCLLRFPVPQWTVSLTYLDLRTSADLKDDNFLFLMLAQCRCLAHLYLGMYEVLPMVSSTEQMHIPSLKSLYLNLCDDEVNTYDPLRLFDTPGLTDLVLDGIHGDWVCALFDPASLPRASFPALTSLSFVNIRCRCEDSEEDPTISSNLRTISSPPLRLFPALTSLTLIHQCFTSNIIFDILGPSSEPWPLLQTLTLCPKEEALNDVYRTLQQVVRPRTSPSEV